MRSIRSLYELLLQSFTESPPEDFGFFADAANTIATHMGADLLTAPETPRALALTGVNVLLDSDLDALINGGQGSVTVDHLRQLPHGFYLRFCASPGGFHVYGIERTVAGQVIVHENIQPAEFPRHADIKLRSALFALADNPGQYGGQVIGRIIPVRGQGLQLVAQLCSYYLVNQLQIGRANIAGSQPHLLPYSSRPGANVVRLGQPIEVGELNRVVQTVRPPEPVPTKPLTSAKPSSLLAVLEKSAKDELPEFSPFREVANAIAKEISVAVKAEQGRVDQQASRVHVLLDSDIDALAADNQGKLSLSHLKQLPHGLYLRFCAVPGQAAGTHVYALEVSESGVLMHENLPEAAMQKYGAHGDIKMQGVLDELRRPSTAEDAVILRTLSETQLEEGALAARLVNQFITEGRIGREFLKRSRQQSQEQSGRSQPLKVPVVTFGAFGRPPVAASAEQKKEAVPPKSTAAEQQAPEGKKDAEPEERAQQQDGGGESASASSTAPAPFARLRLWDVNSIPGTQQGGKVLGFKPRW